MKLIKGLLIAALVAGVSGSVIADDKCPSCPACTDETKKEEAVKPVAPVVPAEEPKAEEKKADETKATSSSEEDFTDIMKDSPATDK
jgi:hypothetical protein